MTEKNERLNEFVIDWNRSHRNFFFTVQWALVIARPIGVALRYAATRYCRAVGWIYLGIVMYIN